jgi:hypothetical protein
MQWAVIWVTILVALTLCLDLVGDLADTTLHGAAWPLPSGVFRNPVQYAVAITIIGAVLVWQSTVRPFRMRALLLWLVVGIACAEAVVLFGWYMHYKRAAGVQAPPGYTLDAPTGSTKDLGGGWRLEDDPVPGAQRIGKPVDLDGLAAQSGATEVKEPRTKAAGKKGKD